MWTYLKFKKRGPNAGERIDRGETLPPEGSMYLAFCTLRGRVVMGYREKRIGCLSILDPNVCDDCNTVAWAPLSETTEPDLALIHASVPAAWREPYTEPANDPWPTLVR